MAGYGAAHKLTEAGQRPVLFDRNSYYGGHTASFTYEGKYTFDEGPHVSFTKHERLQKLFADNIDGKYETLRTQVNNYWRGHWIKHPAQVNLYGLPTDLVVNVVKDFVEARQNPPATIENYEQWLRASFGNTFAETFPMQYTIKYHTTEARNKSLDWIGPRLYQASLDEVLRGALQPASPDVHYISGFRYPSHGGFVSYLKRFMDAAALRLNHRLVGLDPRRRELEFANGERVGYRGVVSSIPLPELVPMIKGAPRDVVEAASRLACTEVVIVNLVIDRAELLDAHWTYIYDHDIFFTRLSTPHLQSPHNVPPGCGSIQAECYYSRKYRPLDRRPVECIEPTVRDLRKMGVLRDEDRILYKGAMHIDYANVIFDLERSEALKIVHGYLDDVGVGYCGRYGDWAYIWTDESFISGEGAAERVMRAT
ncbi:MAG: FAD-dependent oxidoreductase [Burkholderiales bacterium]|nr:FAD-dependent oxidoreductase [Burkholderiales bacterium]